MKGTTCVVRQQEDADSGEIVAATLNGDDHVPRSAWSGTPIGRSWWRRESTAINAIEVATGSAVIHGVAVGLLRFAPRLPARIETPATRGDTKPTEGAPCSPSRRASRFIRAASAATGGRLGYRLFQVLATGARGRLSLSQVPIASTPDDPVVHNFNPINCPDSFTPTWTTCSGNLMHGCWTRFPR